MNSTVLADRPSLSTTAHGARVVTIYAVAVLLVVGLYSYPALHTKAVVQTDRLPVISAPDLPLYLSLSAVESARPGTVLNPYYRIDVPKGRAGYLKFRLSPMMFGGLTRLLSGQMWWSLFLWNAFWWALACVACIWLYGRFLAIKDTLLVLAGLSLLMFFNFGSAKEEIVAWLHFPSLRGFANIGLPFIRSFSPQVALPVLLLYLGLQMLALQKRSDWWPWAAMTALQFFAFATFPYATLLMAGTTGVAVLGQSLLSKQDVAWRTVLLYGIACAAVDSIFVLQDAPALGGGSDSSSIFHFQSQVLWVQMGKLWIFMGALTACVAVSRILTPEIRWTLAGLGATNMLMLLGDAIVPGPPLFLTNHASYFEHATLSILLTFAASVLFAKLRLATNRARLAFGVAICFLSVNGLMLAESGYRRTLPFNREQADMVRWFEGKQVKSNDLVIAQHDSCGWVPLLTQTQVLFCRNAQAMLSPEQNRDLQREREAWYLYFIGKDTAWVDHVSHDPENVHKLETYGLYGEVSSYLGPELTRRLTSSRADLLPKLQDVEAHNSKALAFLRQFPTIWVLDNRTAPLFQRSRLDEYLDIHGQQSSGDLIIYTTTPR